MYRISSKYSTLCLTLFLTIMLMMSCQQVFAHGGVTLSGDDVCIIRIGFLEAHFTGYQPQTQGAEEFCEDIPDVAGSIFVIDYLHDFLREMPVDFRIIKDVENLGVYARWEDITALEDINRDTVFYQPPIIQANGVYTFNYDFKEPGSYIGIITARHPTAGKTYNAVFQFQVGGTDYEYLPLFFILLVLVQFIYWLGNGGIARLARYRMTL